MRSISDKLWWPAFLAGFALLIFHFTIVELGNLPLNPITVALSRVIDPYMHPLFLQNWNFFAPDPVSEDISVIARAKRCERPKACVMSAWFDVSDPMIESQRRNRFSSVAVVQLMLSNAAVELNNKITGDPSLRVKINGTDYIKSEIPMSADPVDEIIIVRTAASAIKSIDPTVRYDQIQVGLFTYKFPRFSKRLEPDDIRSGSLIKTSWTRFPMDVALFVPTGGPGTAKVTQLGDSSDHQR